MIYEHLQWDERPILVCVVGVTQKLVYVKSNDIHEIIRILNQNISVNIMIRLQAIQPECLGSIPSRDTAFRPKLKTEQPLKSLS
jgi:hypothetical protein